MHDLLRAYARDLAASDGDETQAALTRLFDHYLHAAATAMDTLYPAERGRRPRIPAPDGAVLPPVTTSAGAQAWLDAQRGTLVAAVEQMAGHGWPGHAVLLSQTVYRYLFSGGHHGEAVAIHTLARRVARQTGDRAAEANALNGLAAADFRQGRYEQAIGYYEQALVLFDGAGDVTGHARALTNLGLVQWDLGRYDQAIDTHQRALGLFKQTGELLGQAGALNNLGNCHEHQGNYECAAQCFRQAVALYRECGHLLGEANALGNLGIVAERQGRLEEAAAQHRLALALSREAGTLNSQACALDHLGRIAFREGRYGDAIDCHLQALALYQQSGERSAEADARNGLGHAYLAVDQPDSARAQHTAALALAEPIGSRHQQAGAHHGLGNVCHADGDQDLARRHWLAALTIYTAIRAPEADEVRARLAGYSQGLNRRCQREANRPFEMMFFDFPERTRGFTCSASALRQRPGRRARWEESWAGERGHRATGLPVAPDRGEPPLAVDGVNHHAIDCHPGAAVAEPHRDGGDVGAARPVGEGVLDLKVEPAHGAEVLVPELRDSVVPMMPLALGVKH